MSRRRLRTPGDKAIEQAEALSETLYNLLEKPSPEVKRAWETLGVPECLAMLTSCVKKKGQCYGLAIDGFVLGVAVATEYNKLDSLCNQQLVKIPQGNNSKICEER